MTKAIRVLEIASSLLTVPQRSVSFVGPEHVGRREGRPTPRIRLGLAIAMLGSALTIPPVLAIDDVAAPVGTVAVLFDDRDNELVRLGVSATDDLSGVTTVEVSGDGTTWASFPYAPEVDWAVFDPASGGDPDLGNRIIRVRWTDGVGNTSAPVTTRLFLANYGAVEFPVSPITGSLFTIRPIYGPADVINANNQCSWELRWGDTESLRYNHYNSTFGSMYLSGLPDRGFCGAWTFSLPSVPVRQFEVYFNSPYHAISDGDWAARALFYPAAGSTDRRIRSSNLPLVHVIPNTTTMVVGKSITYTAYPIGTVLKSTDIWLVYAPNFAVFKRQEGGQTLTFTPRTPGNWLVTWNGRFRPFTLNATYDPKARYPDVYRPNTTPPIQRIGVASPGTTVPVAVTWSGSDKGWGLAKFQLQRSVDGGAWRAVALPTLKATLVVQQLAPGHHYRYRVRAVDKYGNVGYWDYGPTFKPMFVSDGSSWVTYRGTWSVEPDAGALGGTIHTSTDAGAWAKLTFTGRDVAWIAEKGPGHGRAKVYVDGVLRATIDLAAGADVARQVVFRAHWSTAGAHVVRITVEGTVGRPIADVDGFTVLK